MIQNANELPNLDELISNGYITKRKHPAAKLFIYNYTARAQYSDDWNEATLTCRGLITDGEGNIVSRPFKKFFNLDQVQTLPDEPFQVFDKLDGGYKLATAGTDDVGRSNTAQLMHASEFAFWRNAQMHMAGLGNIVADIDDTEFIIESTRIILFLCSTFATSTTR